MSTGSKKKSLILTSTRKKRILEFLKNHPLGEQRWSTPDPANRLWLEELCSFVKEVDTLVTLEDVIRWTEIHDWIIRYPGKWQRPSTPGQRNGASNFPERSAPATVLLQSPEVTTSTNSPPHPLDQSQCSRPGSPESWTRNNFDGISAFNANSQNAHSNITQSPGSSSSNNDNDQDNSVPYNRVQLPDDNFRLPNFNRAFAEQMKNFTSCPFPGLRIEDNSTVGTSQQGEKLSGIASIEPQNPFTGPVLPPLPYSIHYQFPSSLGHPLTNQSSRGSQPDTNDSHPVIPDQSHV